MCVYTYLCVLNSVGRIVIVKFDAKYYINILIHFPLISYSNVSDSFLLLNYQPSFENVTCVYVYIVAK